MAGNRIKAMYIPVNERTWLVGYSELMGYIGVESREKLIRDYINEGLWPRVWKNQNRWKREEVDRFIDEHDESQQVTVSPGRQYKRTAAAN